ncbi:hypothetical protein EV356DRAFT_447860 [Viridothelium virens]|uniref:Metallo-beta-lactamase domain-containing protein n=1 Tax=Viridothelium virens TaxID=1048519 RepID=A0A6A6H711_VIRVR|nr:hypothetical protein EV356DRAFT_447860 [Viridothelium virens]
MLVSAPLYSLIVSVGAHSVQARSSYVNASQILQETVKALGGIDVLNSINSFSYEALTIYRSQTLTQNYKLMRSDQSVSAAGSQIMSFKEGNNTLHERIDRGYRYNDYWIWAWPDLVPEMNYSMVLQDGPQGFACFNQGQNSFYADDPTEALGYADAYLADYLVHQAHQFAIPWLIKQFLGLTLVINNHLPYMVRSYEQHKIFGRSTSDVIFSNYSMFGSVLLPQRFQTVYNTVNMVEDFFVDNMSINPTWPADYFEPKSNTTRKAPAQSLEYPRSEVHEFFESALWDGPFTFDISDVVVEYPVPGVPAIKSVYVGYADYVQLLVEFDEGFLITDASPFRSQILLNWVKENSRKNITHVVPSHHHRDHAGGVGDYVAAGAKLVVPEIARAYYTNVNGGQVEFVTYTQEQPFILDDGNVQFRSFWREENPHAVDWSYGIATSSCPKNGTGVVVYVADVVDPGSVPGYSTSDALRWDAGYARQFILNAAQDGVPRSSLILGAHGSAIDLVHNSESLEKVANITGVVYPNIEVGSLAGTYKCR